ncbi:hypothetical protein CUC08_Gglean012981 [Alternaria sp. MG1]|nr:hypothetical protein CUC08_Gglean012981 [Alternaria sp. MG1]
MSVQPIDPVSDPRVEHRYATLNGQKYHYLYAVPRSGDYQHTVFLIHGWPDLSIGWRYQIPFLVDMGMRVVAPDMMGYGETVRKAQKSCYPRRMLDVGIFRTLRKSRQTRSSSMDSREHQMTLLRWRKRSTRRRSFSVATTGEVLSSGEQLSGTPTLSHMSSRSVHHILLLMTSTCPLKISPMVPCPNLLTKFTSLQVRWKRLSKMSSRSGSF